MAITKARRWSVDWRSVRDRDAETFRPLQIWPEDAMSALAVTKPDAFLLFKWLPDWRYRPASAVGMVESAAIDAFMMPVDRCDVRFRRIELELMFLRYVRGKRHVAGVVVLVPVLMTLVRMLPLT